MALRRHPWKLNRRTGRYLWSKRAAWTSSIRLITSSTWIRTVLLIVLRRTALSRRIRRKRSACHYHGQPLKRSSRNSARQRRSKSTSLKKWTRSIIKRKIIAFLPNISMVWCSKKLDRTFSPSASRSFAATSPSSSASSQSVPIRTTRMSRSCRTWSRTSALWMSPG